MNEVRLALRTLSKAPLFTTVAAVSLALGIGANTAMFGLVDQILLRLLPVHNPRELVQLQIDGGRFGSNSGDGTGTFSHPLYLALRDRNTVLAGLTGQTIVPASLMGEDRGEVVSVGMVAGNFFDVLGVRPHLGRLLGPEDDRVKNARMLSFLSTGFALLATLLAVVGLYGVLAFVVTRRTREIGIRMALGAERGSVIRLVLREMLALFVFGVAAGVGAGLAGSRYVESQLFGVDPSDPAVFAFSATALLAAALAAGFLPAWRAARIDPIRALRHD